MAPYPYFLLALIIAGCSTLSDDTTSGETQPNIIICYADDLGWTDLGVQGSPYYETPNIDRLAREGMRFTQAYANAANCAPSRACLITGRYSPRHGVYTVGSAARGASKHRKLIPVENTTILDTSLMTLPKWLQAQGYATCMAGKWHLSHDPKPYGFDTNFGGYAAGMPASYFSPYQNPFLSDGPEGEHLPYRLAREVSHWIIQHKQHPFFVYLPFYSVHTPIQADASLQARFESKETGRYHDNAAYAAMIYAMDQAVGSVLNTLDSLELTSQTLVIFSSDNGPFGGVSSARPLRGTKGMFYEGGIRVPLIVRWPGTIEKGSINPVPVMGSDFFPTIAGALKTKPPAALDGENLMPLLTGTGKIAQRDLFWHFPAYLQMYKKDKGYGDAHDPPYWRSTPCSVIRSGPWKLIQYYEDGEVELFNLEQDPGETTDVSKDASEITEQLLAQLQTWKEETNAPVPQMKNPEYMAQ